MVSDANSTAREVNTVKQPFTRLRPATLCCSVATALKALSSHSCSDQHTQPSPVRPLTSVPEFTRLSMSSHRFQNLLASLCPHIGSRIYSLFWFLLVSVPEFTRLCGALLTSGPELTRLSSAPPRPLTSVPHTRRLLRVSVSGITRFSRVLRLLRYQVFVFLHPFWKSLGLKESVLPQLFRNIRISLVSFLLYARCSE